MYLLVGLGNPGDKYTYTRHNVGFLFIDAFTKQYEEQVRLQPNLQGAVAEIRDPHEKYIALKPQTFMNVSGESVSKVIAKFGIEPEQVIVISDDTNLDLGVVRTRFGGEAGGHNGLKSIIKHIGNDFWRIRVGVGTNPEQIPLEKWVLGKLTDEEIKTLHKQFQAIIQKYFQNGVKLQEETIR